MAEKLEYTKERVEGIPKVFMEDVHKIMTDHGSDRNFTKLETQNELIQTREANNCSVDVLKRAMIISALFAINFAYYLQSELISIGEYTAKIEKYLPRFNELLKDFFVSREDKRLCCETSEYVLHCLEKTMGCTKKEIENVAFIFLKHGVMECITGFYSPRNKEQEVSNFQRTNIQQMAVTHLPMDNSQATFPVNLNVRTKDFVANFQCKSKEKVVLAEAIRNGCTQHGRPLPHLEATDGDTAEKASLKCQYTLNNNTYEFPAVETETDKVFSLVIVRAENP